MATTEHKSTPMAENELNAPARWWGHLRLVGWSLAVVILLAPAVAMLFTPEVDWGPGDFLFAGIVLGGTGLLFELAVRRSRDDAFRWGVLVALAVAFLMTWSNAAVGIVGSGANPANVLYFAVLAIAFVGCLASGFRAKGMSLAMFATASAQALVTLLAIVFNWGDGEEQVFQVAGINAFFIAFWCASAVLFRRSAQGT